LNYYLITQRHSNDNYGQHIDSLENNYIKYFNDYNINIIIVPNLNFDINSITKNINISGIILTGGGDVDPILYGSKRNISLNISSLRDRTEYTLLNYAISDNIPVLGICRGMQLINVFFGGKLLKSKNKLHPIGVNHDITIVDKNISEKLGSNIYQVNSYHEIIIPQKYLSNKLEEFAIDGAGNIEGYKHKKMPIWGIQWHPERSCPADGTLLSEYITKRYLDYNIN
jgi:gamma-glutamyl-gamma-aminobutyrate hydrolase PuuD